LAKELKKNQFNKIFIFNSSLRFNIVARIANIKKIYQYPFFKKTNQHIIQPAKDLIKKNLGIDVSERPSNWN
jgi:heptosyltransferase-2